MKLHDHFERVYLVSLESRKERRQRLLDHLQKIGLADSARVIWVRAVEGNRCPPPSYFKAGAGAWGCLQTHLRIVQEALMDELDHYLVLEDDVVFHPRSAELLDTLMDAVPDDWGQIYLGGQHLTEPEALPDRPALLRCKNVNRTHAFALRSVAMELFQQHISNAPDYVSRGPWHIDHQLGLAHEQSLWSTYAPTWWLAGQEAGESNITGRCNPRLWWQPSRYRTGLPFVFAPPELDPRLAVELRNRVHFGNNLKVQSFEDIGLDACTGSQDALRDWLLMIAGEALDMGLLPGLQHPGIQIQQIRDLWPAGAVTAEMANIEALSDYPYNGLFDHVPGSATPIAAVA